MGKLELEFVHSWKSANLSPIYIGFQGEGDCEINGRLLSFKTSSFMPDIAIMLKRSIYELMGNPNPFRITIEWNEPDQSGSGTE